MFDQTTLITLGVGVLIVVPTLIFLIKLILSCYQQVPQGKALIVNPMNGDPKVTFTGMIVLPIINRSEVMDISLKKIEIDRSGSAGLICADNIRADIKVTFFVRVNKTAEDVLKVAQSIGCERASEQGTLEELFQAKFSEALKTVGKQLEFEMLYQERTRFKEEIIKTIGTDLNGFSLEDVAIDYLEQTPLDKLCENNILDAQGIKKITELTSRERIKTNEFKRNQDKVITQQNVDAREKILELERQQAEAELNQKREISSIRAEQEAEAAVILSQQTQRSELARLKTEEEVGKATANKDREVQVADKNKQRVLAIETERVEKARQLEVNEREREVELMRIEKEKQLEVERKNIQDVIRQRVAVEKTVAEEEERIKDARAFFTAERSKKVAVLAAEQQAQGELVKKIKEAEARETSAKHYAAEAVTLANAELAKAEKVAQAKLKMSEGIAAETAAEGMARVRVKEADAGAIEKVGTAEAKATREKGTAEAEVLRQRVTAEAQGLELKGTADAKARLAAAEAVEKYGMAEAVAIREKILGEAVGLKEKAESMKALDDATRAHEEFRLNIEKERAVELAQVSAQVEVAKNQGHVLSSALEHAKIDIVGGDGAFFDKITSAVGNARAVDTFINRSQTAQVIGKEYLNGEASLFGDLKEILTHTKVGTEDLKNLSVTALFSKLMLEAKDDVTRKKINRVIEHAAKLQLKE